MRATAPCSNSFRSAVYSLRFLTQIAIAIMIAGVAVAQAPSEPPSAGTWSISPYVGGGRHSPAGYNWGTTPDRNHFILGLHFATPVLRAGPFSLMYAPNATPLIMVSNNPRYRWVVTGGIARKVEASRGPVFGAGVAPFGIQGEVRATRAVEVYSEAALGGMWFNDFMPTDGARRFNFSIEFGGGVYLWTNHHHAIQLGYKFLHMSNMYTARENPGVDGHVFYLGLRWQKRLPRE
jgi:hypothetical protein